MRLDLSISEISTIKLALSAWSERCKSEARVMREFVEQFPDTAEQCERNATASDKFRADATALFNRL